MVRLTDDTKPGITRRRKGRYWQYFKADGTRITARAEIDRLNAVGMPPAYTDCWFCPDPDGHIQAVGYDDKGRKQYRYHPDYRARREKKKYRRLAEFGAALPRLRRRIEADLRGKATDCTTVVAAVVHLIDETYMRVGNEGYARANKSFGATTLRNRHATVNGHTIRIRFAGKHGVVQEMEVADRRLARIAAKTRALPGQHLFAFLDENDLPCRVGSADVNAYIREATGGDFTAKDFRTWGASVIALAALATHAKGVKGMIEPVAEALGNTPAIARKSYVHPALVAVATNGGAEGIGPLPRATRYLSRAERGFLDFLGGA
jgi:DNA topoisomerase-1